MDTRCFPADPVSYTHLGEGENGGEAGWEGEAKEKEEKEVKLKIPGQRPGYLKSYSFKTYGAAFAAPYVVSSDLSGFFSLHGHQLHLKLCSEMQDVYKRQIYPHMI